MGDHSRMSDNALRLPVGDNFLPPVMPASELNLRPGRFLDHLVTWAAMIGVLILLTGGLIIAAVLWFGSVLFAAHTPDEGPGE